ncbi:hypothetical protein HAX54_002599, partial [Datura stramonium]|nr:hypothetical protein [Datura stramonium]
KLDMLGFCVYQDFLWHCNVSIYSSARHLILGVWGWFLACVAGAFVRTTHEWCSAWAVRLDPYLRSDVITQMSTQSWGRHKLGSLKVGFLCFLPNAQALLCPIGCLSPLARCVRVKPKAALLSHIFLASSCDVLVHEWQLGPSDL